jgi:hypothetical protein
MYTSWRWEILSNIFTSLNATGTEGAFSKLNSFASPQMRNDGTQYLQGILKESQEEVRVLKQATKEAALTAQELAEARTKSEHLEKDVQRLKVRFSVVSCHRSGRVEPGWPHSSKTEILERELPASFNPQLTRPRPAVLRVLG